MRLNSEREATQLSSSIASHWTIDDNNEQRYLCRGLLKLTLLIIINIANHNTFYLVDLIPSPALSQLGPALSLSRLFKYIQQHTAGFTENIIGPRTF